MVRRSMRRVALSPPIPRLPPGAGNQANKLEYDELELAKKGDHYRLGQADGHVRTILADRDSGKITLSSGLTHLSRELLHRWRRVRDCTRSRATVSSAYVRPLIQVADSPGRSDAVRRGGAEARRATRPCTCHAIAERLPRHRRAPATRVRTRHRTHATRPPDAGHTSGYSTCRIPGTRALARGRRQAREDAGISQRALARAAGLSAATVHDLELGRYDPRTETVARVSAVLGMDLSIRLYPGSGPLIRDHAHLAMVEALMALLHRRWRPTPEVPVYRPVRGVIDLVLDPPQAPLFAEAPLVACEAQSELRRLDQQLRWSRAKADALSQSRGQTVERLLLLRSTRRTRAVVAEYAAMIGAAYPARSSDAHAALCRPVPWPGDALLWCTIEQGRARILMRPPRGISVGR